MRALVTMTALALVMSGGVAFAQMEEYDTDNDQMITESEFTQNAPIGDQFSEWDEDGDGLLSEEEFGSAVFGTYDEDDDDTWTQEEFAAFEDDD